MKKHLNLIFSLLSLTTLLILPYFVFAADTSPTMLERLQSVAKSGGYATDGSTGLLAIIGLAVNAILGLLGAIFLILMIFAGFQWMTASGNEEQTKKAVGTIKHAIIGLIITLSSWAIWTFIFEGFIMK